MSRLCLLLLAALLVCARAYTDPERKPAEIVDDENTELIGELGSPFHVRCLAEESRDPTLFVFWYRGPGKAQLLYNDSVYGLRRNVLLIRSLGIETLGQYTCQGFNAEGMKAPRMLVVRAYWPEGLLNGHLWLVPRDQDSPRSQPSTAVTATTTTPKTTFTEHALHSRGVLRGTMAPKTPATPGPFAPVTIVQFAGQATTESSKTSEGSTTNEGSTDVIGTSTVDICSGFVFGCCADNETEALGPDEQGCPCNTTEFGCCPDGVSPASGLSNEGCPGPCSKSSHGCCQDNKTPAHGPDFEGCCLLQTYGCCPDNRKPAEGPHLEGCGCQYALHGCCPDNVTVAQGPGNQGCGCEYTQHGCCPDRHTAASGPNNEGCTCKTYQFGCCADGDTIAVGPEQQGCYCYQSKFGCCGDGVTHATGPNADGCGCSSSKHGCCSDGRTKAVGPKLLGCTDAPENNQGACSMSTDPGPCNNFTAMWYYDLTYGGCSRFWYGGCNGNSNRFGTKEECEDVCVQPSPKDACKLPGVKGACEASFHRWHYNSTQERCVPFIYGGCLGNANNFDTRELCQKLCERSSDEDEPSPPQALPNPAPEVPTSEGGIATLRCLFHGNPPPKITWRFGEITIDGTAGRYRLISDGALEIVSVYRNDTGVYVCVADNGFGVATQERHLVVNDPVNMPARIAGDENAVLTGELGRPLHLRCLAYGYPPPSVFWYHGYEGTIVPYNDAVYEPRGNVLLIRRLTIDILGQYTCQAYNGEGKAASWVVLVQAYLPEGENFAHDFLIPRDPVAPGFGSQPPITAAELTTTTTSTTSEASRPYYTVPVSAHMSTKFSTLNIGNDLRLTCEVDGFPEPEVYWTKDGANIQTDGRITITSSWIVSRLTVTQVSVADSGLYACHASNRHSSQSDTAQINVQQLVVPAKCTDNPAFAGCALIVRSKFCRHKYYSKFCCKSCVEAGQLGSKEAELQADQPLRKK